MVDDSRISSYRSQMAGRITWNTAMSQHSQNEDLKPALTTFGIRRERPFRLGDRSGLWVPTFVSAVEL